MGISIGWSTCAGMTGRQIGKVKSNGNKKNQNDPWRLNIMP
jgi:hypothetical protein